MDTINTYIFGRITAKKVTLQNLPKSAILLKFDYMVNDNFEIDFNKQIAVYTTKQKTYYRFI